MERRRDFGHFRGFGSFKRKFGGWYIDFGDGGKFGGCMHFGFEGVDRFGAWHSKGDEELED